MQGERVAGHEVMVVTPVVEMTDVMVEVLWVLLEEKLDVEVLLAADVETLLDAAAAVLLGRDASGLELGPGVDKRVKPGPPLIEAAVGLIGPVKRLEVCGAPL